MNPTGTTITAIPDTGRQPLGAPGPATAVTVARVLQRKTATVPVAAFQSSI